MVRPRRDDMKATLRDGRQVSAFTDFYEARAAGMLSRSSWRRERRVVTEDAAPAGIVVKHQGKVRRDAGPWLYPILGEQDVYLLVADDWYEVFDKDRTVLKSNPVPSKAFALPLGEVREPSKG